MQSTKTDRLLSQINYCLNTALTIESKYQKTNHPKLQISFASQINSCTVKLIEFAYEAKNQDDLTEQNVEFLQSVKETIKRLASEYSWAR